MTTTSMSQITTTDPTARIQQEYSHILGHKLANLLTPIVGITELLATRVNGGYDAEMVRLVESLRSAALMTRDTIFRLRDIHLLECGLRAVSRRPGNLATLLTSVTGEIADGAVQHGVTIAVSGMELDAMIDMDFDLLPQAFEHIIRNAVEHVAQDRESRDRTVHVTLSREGTSYRVAVENGGEPLTDAQRSTFFEKFNGDHARKPRGLGLGTTYARHIVLSHGGSIAVERSETGRTVVTVKLPEADEAAR